MRMILWLCGALVLLIGSQARAACTTAPAVSGSFAATTSYDLRSSTVPTVTLPATLTCNGTVITLMSSDYARATVTSANGFRLRAAGGDSIGYRLSADSGGTVAFTQGSTVNYLDPSLLSLLTILGSSSLVPTMYASVTEAPNLPAGDYTDTVTVSWSWQICHGVGLNLSGVRVCVLEETGTSTATITINLTVTRDCRIIAPAVAFGSAPLAGSFAAVSQAVAVDCTKGTAYKVAFTSGTNGASRPWRAMSDGAGNRLQYNLYRPDGTTIWDETNPLTAATPGTGALTPAQMFPYVARINPTQSPVAGTYTDTVSVVITF